MNQDKSPTPIAVAAESVAPRAKPSNYPEPFYSRMTKREKRALGDAFGLRNFGVNLTRIAPGGESALMHRHSKQDEFVYVLEGEPTLVTEAGEVALGPGLCAGFPAMGAAHKLVNRTGHEVVYLEVGDRLPGDEVDYPNDDIKAALDAEGKYRFSHKDGRPY